MRQTEMDKGFLAGRPSERSAPFPQVFLFRGRAGDGQDCIAAFDRRSIVLSRPVAGMACKIRLSLRQYHAVAVVAEADRHTVRLFHHDPGLSVDIAEIDSFEEAEDYGERLADALDLPSLVMGRGAPAGCSAEPQPTRRATRTVRSRRARFLTNRQTGSVSPIRRLDPVEIIAQG